MLARGSHQNRLRAARLAETFPAEHPPPRRGHSIYGGSGQTGLADNDRNRRPGQLRRHAPRPARDRCRKFLMVRLATVILGKVQFGAETTGLSLTDAPSRFARTRILRCPVPSAFEAYVIV